MKLKADYNIIVINNVQRKKKINMDHSNKADFMRNSFFPKTFPSHQFMPLLVSSALLQFTLICFASSLYVLCWVVKFPMQNPLMFIGIAFDNTTFL